MVERSEILNLVTAYADNQLNNDTQINHIKSLIDTDEEIRYEYQIQAFLKTYVKNKVPFVETPLTLKEKINSTLFNELTPKKTQPNLFGYIFSLIKQPVYAFGLAVVLLGTFLMVFLSGNNPDNMANSQTGDKNMFVEARSNFRKILSGSLNLQYQSSDPQAIREYFKEHGVNYNTVIPRLKNSQLIGAVVSDRNGEKFAHHMYKTNTGNFVYLYQADEKCIKKKKNLDLTDDLVKFVDEGKLYKYAEDGHSFIVWKNAGNICVVVSNENMDNLERELTSTREYK